jgi:hypothetical protein
MERWARSKETERELPSADLNRQAIREGEQVPSVLKSGKGTGKWQLWGPQKEGLRTFCIRSMCREIEGEEVEVYRGRGKDCLHREAGPQKLEPTRLAKRRLPDWGGAWEGRLPLRDGGCGKGACRFGTGLCGKGRLHKNLTKND